SRVLAERRSRNPTSVLTPGTVGGGKEASGEAGSPSQRPKAAFAAAATASGRTSPTTRRVAPFRDEDVQLPLDHLFDAHRCDAVDRSEWRPGVWMSRSERRVGDELLHRFRIRGLQVLDRVEHRVPPGSV